MLLLRTTETFQKVLVDRFVPLVILPASAPGESRDESKTRANDLAVDGRIAGLGITVVESKAGELFVLVSDNESQAVGFARKLLQESKLAEPWFLLLRNVQRLCVETADRTREDCPLTETGFGAARWSHLRDRRLVCSGPKQYCLAASFWARRWGTLVIAPSTGRSPVQESAG